MFGYIKKETVETMLTKEIELNRKMYEKYSNLLNAHMEHAEEGECYKREEQRLANLADEYFSRYQESKEILKKINQM
jgi:transcriptional regulatory protein LevR